MLQCRNCGAPNSDPGGPANIYLCGRCHQRTLFRVEEARREAATSATMGALIGGLLAANPIGAVVGGLIGLVLGYERSKKGPPQ